MKYSLIVLSVVLGLFVGCERSTSLTFCGVRLGDNVPYGLAPVSVTELFCGYSFKPEDALLKFNQYNFHASLVSKTITSIGAGYTTYVEEDAAKLFDETCSWLEHKYPGKQCDYKNHPYRKIKTMYLGDKSEAYYMVEQMVFDSRKYVVVLSFSNRSLSELEEREAKEYSLEKQIKQTAPIQYNVAQLNNHANKGDSLHSNFSRDSPKNSSVSSNMTSISNSTEVGENDLTLQEGWSRVEVPGYVLIDIPPTMELQNGPYKVIRETYSKLRLIPDIGGGACVLTFQQAGSNDSEDGALRRYARITFKTFYDEHKEFGYQNGDDYTEELEFLDEIEYHNAKKSIANALKTGMSSSKLLKWYPIKSISLGGAFGYRIALLRQEGNNEPVYVETYKIPHGHSLYVITFSYRQSEERFWSEDYQKIKSRIKLLHER